MSPVDVDVIAAGGFGCGEQFLCAEPSRQLLLAGDQQRLRVPSERTLPTRVPVLDLVPQAMKDSMFS
jgi:hypothetical protein